MSSAKPAASPVRSMADSDMCCVPPVAPAAQDASQSDAALDVARVSLRYLQHEQANELP